MSGMDVKPPHKTMDEPIVNAPVIEEKVAEAVVEAPGSKTDSALLLESLQEEREKRRIAEKEKKELEEKLSTLQTNNEEVFSDEGKALQRQILELDKKLSLKEKQEQLASVQSRYPQLKDKSAEFDKFREENGGLTIEQQAKVFLVENEMLETTQRKGLERASGGGRTVEKQGITQEDIATLRVNNPRKFRDMVKSGQIK